MFFDFFTKNIKNKQKESRDGIENFKEKYLEVINEAEQQYTDALNTYKKLDNIIEKSLEHKKETELKLKNTKKQIEGFAKENLIKQEDQNLIVSALNKLENDIKYYNKELDLYAPMRDKAKLIYLKQEKYLNNLKQKLDYNIRSLEMNYQAKNLYNSLSSLKTDNDSTLLNKLEENTKEIEEEAFGAKEVYDNSLTNRLELIDEEVSPEDKYTKYLNKLINKKESDEN